MDPIKNPFSPGAGSPPPELVGRDGILERSRILFGRILAKRPEKSLLLTGLRGVGKTVLLNEMYHLAVEAGYRSILFEVHEGKSFSAILALHLRSLLFELNRLAGAGDKVRRALAVLRSFISAVKVTVGDLEVGLDIEPLSGTADSGDLELDVPSLLVAVAEAAQERNSAVALLIDEVQYLSQTELSALIMGMHKMQQLQLPLALIGAGLPVLPGLAGESKSYAERLFDFPAIGPLSKEDAAKALQDPAGQAGVRFDSKALDEIYEFTQGYPYFVQEWGYQAWNSAEASPITVECIRQTSPQVMERLDANFFRVRFDRLTPREKDFLRAMARLEPAGRRTAEIAELLGVKVTSLGPLRAGLIKKGMVYSPAHGEIAFTVPLFDQFMCRVMPDSPSHK
jgi:hypothetical protein